MSTNLHLSMKCRVLKKIQQGEEEDEEEEKEIQACTGVETLNLNLI